MPAPAARLAQHVQSGPGTGFGGLTPDISCVRSPDDVPAPDDWFALSGWRDSGLEPGNHRGLRQLLVG
jgi:hypothetical protein